MNGPDIDDKASLLERLRIDRREEGRTPAPDAPTHDLSASESRWRAIAAACGVLALLTAGFLAWQCSARRLASVTPAAASAASSADSAVSTTAGTGAVAGTSVLDASGYIVAEREATVSSKILGKVRDVLIQEGQHVQAGQIIAHLDDSNYRAALELARAQLTQATASLEAARVALADARPIFERNAQERKEQVISAQDFDTAKSAYDSAQSSYDEQQAAVIAARAGLDVAQRNEDDTVIRAPFSGVVTVKAAQVGEIVSPMATSGFTRTGIATIVDMDSLEADVDVSESFINRVHPGQPAVVRLNAYPDWAIPASVLAIIPTADRSKATVTVRVAFKVKDPRILPEMGTRVSFLAEKTAKAQGRS